MPPTIASITGAQTLCSADTLELAAAFNGTPGLSYSWSGTGNFLFGSGNANALVTGAASGVYTVTVSNACGSATGTVNVTVNPTTNDTTTISACDTYTWSVNNQVYTASGTYTNVVGCDTDVLVLTITPSTGGSLTASACDTYTWTANNQTYTASGTYTNTVGCNTDTLVLTITPSTGGSLTASACDSYTWTANNQTYTASGTYTNTVGCNTDTLVLTINQGSGSSTASGTYTNTVGCNTDTLVLTITPITGGSLTASACDTYTWTANNQTYTASGTYTNTVGCNTDTLVLTITPSTGGSLTASACGTYTWTANNQTYTASGTYTHTVGCNTDTLVLTLTIPGTACDDGNPNTTGDVYNATCVCVGTPIGGCTTNEVTLTLTTDANGSQTSYDIVNIGTTVAVCSGTGYASNSTIPVTCCLANGCYELRVFDSAGDGIVPGGYVLTDASGKRIIDNAGDGFFTNVSQIALNLGFCVPQGTDGVIAAHRDKENWLTNEVIQAQVNPAVTAQFGVHNANSGYQFWFYNPDGGYSRRVLQTHAAPGGVTTAAANVRSAYVRLSSLVTSPLPNGVLLNVKVRTQVNGVYSAFGPACRFKILGACVPDHAVDHHGYTRDLLRCYRPVAEQHDTCEHGCGSQHLPVRVLSPWLFAPSCIHNAINGPCLRNTAVVGEHVLQCAGAHFLRWWRDVLPLRSIMLDDGWYGDLPCSSSS
ncbi:MAG: hypothetical protein IPO90_14505 [Flavobacteriales bacterium]|nr:hypothetical protein [Flavobacteriales bacterium]